LQALPAPAERKAPARIARKLARSDAGIIFAPMACSAAAASHALALRRDVAPRKKD
jgi:hypothetical protein